MKVIKSITEMRQTAEALRRNNHKLALVPTMGYLHEGHLSLIRESHKRAEIIIVSIFVNPAQFGPEEDFQQYPREFEHDEQLCQAENVDIVFYPDVKEIYRKNHLTYISTENLADKLCGISRPIHFRGVTTIVTKLFNIVNPHVAVFGQKDAQQALILRQMVADLNFDIDIIIAPIVREEDGLALSSRNKYLTQEERKDALLISKSLMEAQKIIKHGENKSSIIISTINQQLNRAKLLKSEYIEIVDYQTLEPVSTIGTNTLIAIAAHVGKTRLIDNIIIE